MRRFFTHVSALVGAFVGFYAGLLSLLALAGLESASWTPLFASVGSGLFAGTAVAIVGESANARIVPLGAGGGLLLGVALTAIDPDLTVVAIVLAIFSQVLAALPRSIPWLGADRQSTSSETSTDLRARRATVRNGKDEIS